MFGGLEGSSILKKCLRRTKRFTTICIWSSLVGWITLLSRLGRPSPWQRYAAYAKDCPRKSLTNCFFCNRSIAHTMLRQTIVFFMITSKQSDRTFYSEKDLKIWLTDWRVQHQIFQKVEKPFGWVMWKGRGSWQRIHNACFENSVFC